MDGRLNYRDVEHLVAGLPDRMLEELVKGPLPDGDDATSPWNCRVCSILRGPGRIPPAEKLLDWHEFEADTPQLDALYREDGPLHDSKAAEEWQVVAGALSHARCLVIYSLARLERNARLGL